MGRLRDCRLKVAYGTPRDEVIEGTGGGRVCWVSWVGGLVGASMSRNSEYIRRSIREDQHAQEGMAELRQALTDGEESGKPKVLDISAIKSAGRKRIDAI